MPVLKEGKIPQEIRSQLDLAFKYAPDFSLRNDDYIVSFSNKAISFEMVGEYKLWGNYFEFIKAQLGKLFQNGIIKTIERIGVRYASVFGGLKINDILKYSPSLGLDGYNEKASVFRAHLTKNNYKMYLQITNEGRVKKGDKILSGVVIDIDSSTLEPSDPNSDVFEKIDQLHSLEKELFFELLKPDFLESLNPKY